VTLQVGPSGKRFASVAPDWPGRAWREDRGSFKGYIPKMTSCTKMTHNSSFTARRWHWDVAHLHASHGGAGGVLEPTLLVLQRPEWARVLVSAHRHYACTG
jgi:hypothetical protein